MPISVRAEFFAALPARFLEYYRDTFRGHRMIYGHWSGGLYSQALGSYHRQVAVLRPTELDQALEQYLEARNRRVGGAISGLWQIMEDLKGKATLQTFVNAPYDQDLSGHTRGRDANSVALAIMCGAGARPNELGPAAPLPVQISTLARLVAEACLAVRAPVERFLTGSEAADNLDYPRMDDPSAPHPPCGFRTSREAWDLEAWVEPPGLVVFAPLQSYRPGWQRLGDWLREAALQEIARVSAPEWGG